MNNREIVKATMVLTLPEIPFVRKHEPMTSLVVSFMLIWVEKRRAQCKYHGRLHTENCTATAVWNNPEK